MTVTKAERSSYCAAGNRMKRRPREVMSTARVQDDGRIGARGGLVTTRPFHGPGACVMLN